MLIAAAAAACVCACVAASAAQAASPVAVFPLPGTTYNTTQTQIVFQGIAPGQIGQVRVTGSKTGTHSGQLKADSDGQGASFVPDKPFAADETVTVSTHLDLLGGHAGAFSFKIANPAGLIPYGKAIPVAAGRDGARFFSSQPSLQPPTVSVLKDSAPVSDGDIFVAPQSGPIQNGPMILDPHGNLVWFDPVPIKDNTLITDFRVQSLHGQPVLTWWQGNSNGGQGRGVGVILDRNYRQIATVHAGEGLDMDLHEFHLTNDGDAYVNSIFPVRIAGIREPVLDDVVQEIDVATGLVKFEWDALDHLPLSDSAFKPGEQGALFDPFHVNSVGLDSDGNLIVSMRNTDAVYKINHSSGQTIWRLGGKRSSFKMGPGTSTAFQHDAVVQPDGSLTLFDDGAGPPTVHSQSRGVHESINTKTMTATLIRQYTHSPSLLADYEGSVQELPGGETIVGWGQQPYFTEFNSAGQEDLDARFVVSTPSYRAYRFTWSGQPTSAPALAVSRNSNGSALLSASWNGATDVASWQVLAGKSATSLSVVNSVAKRYFETEITEGNTAPYFAVRALDASGQVLASSPTVSTASRVTVYGRSAFVSGSGLGGLPVTCQSSRTCQLVTTVSAGHTVIAQSGAEALSAGGGRILYFQLSAQGRSLLSHASQHRIATTITVRDSASGTSISASVNLVGFSTSGAGPKRSVNQAPPVEIMGVTDFVSSGWVGGILSGCQSNRACRLTATVSYGGHVISTSSAQSVGPNQLGYLIFTLTSTGHQLLTHAAGNQLPVSVSVTDGKHTATGQIALVAF